MLGRLLRWAALIIVAAMLTGHVTELFDHWDHTLRTGREADYTLVVLAACAGLEIVLAGTLLRFFRVLPALQNPRLGYRPAPLDPSFAETPVAGPSPPLLFSLRI